MGSVIVPVDYDQSQIFEIWFDPMPLGEGPPRYRLSIFHNGRPVLLEKTPLQPFAYGEEAIGANGVGSSAGRASFGGTVLALTRMDSANLSRHILPERNESAAAVRFRLPPPSDNRAQPLMVFSRADGRQGLLALRRAGASIEIGWRDAAGWWWSGSLAVPAEGSHRVSVQWPLAGGTVEASPFETLIAADGIICRPPRPEFFSAVIAQVTAWHNPWPADPEVAEHFARHRGIGAFPSAIAGPARGPAGHAPFSAGRAVSHGSNGSERAVGHDGAGRIGGWIVRAL